MGSYFKPAPQMMMGGGSNTGMAFVGAQSSFTGYAPDKKNTTMFFS